MIGTIRRGLKEDGHTVSISQLCRWFEVPLRTMYYRPTRKLPTVQYRSASASRSNVSGW